MLGFVGGLEEKRALRLACKRSRDWVDGRVVTVAGNTMLPAEPVVTAKLFLALARAPWNPQRLDLCGIGLNDTGAASLAKAHRTALQELRTSAITPWARQARRPWRQRAGPRSRC